MPTGLATDTPSHCIAVQVEGIPLGRYYAQLIALLRQQGLAHFSSYLAIPVFGHNAQQVQWFYPGPVQQHLPWRQASAQQQLGCLEKLLQWLDAITALRKQLQALSLPSGSLIDQLLYHLTHLPAIAAIQIINEHPVILFWGYYIEGQQPLDLQQMYTELLHQQCPKDDLISTPAVGVQSADPIRTRPLKKIALLTLVAVLVSGGLGITGLRGTKIPVSESPPLRVNIPAESQLLINRLVSTAHLLPRQPATVTPVPPAPKVPVKKTSLMISPQSRYHGNVDFLQGDWRLTDNSLLPLSRLRFRFNHGRSITTFNLGKRHCTTISQAAFTAAGELQIASARAQCQGRNRISLPTIICRKSRPNTQCYWQDTDLHRHPVTLFQEP